MINKTDLSPGESEAYQKAGFVWLPQIIEKKALREFAEHLRHLMRELDLNDTPLEERSLYKRAFTQVTNLWRHSTVVRDFVFNRDLARLAADIMQVNGVRLYHDQALFKEPGGGATPWHVDQVYWPLDTLHVCTLWIPLQDISLEMGPLAFAQGSKRINEGRELVISGESENFYADLVEQHNLELSCKTFDLGDISLHGGWIVHHAGPNLTSIPREVMTIIYMAEDTRLLKNPSQTQLVDRDAFIPGVQPGQLAASELNPVLYSKAN